nr:MAG TPA: head closure knob [Caudoviricetes sp.]
MRYNERCTIITRKSVEGYLGEREEEKKEEVVCAVSSFSYSDKSLGFGNFKKTGFRIHIQGQYVVDRIIYNKKEYQPMAQHFNHNSTVLEVI